MKKHLKYLRVVFLGLGLFLLYTLIRKIGVSAIVDSIRTIGWNFSWLLLIQFGWYVSYTLAWRQLLKHYEARPKFLELLRIKLVGETINVMTPANFLGGDPMRIYMLRHHIPATQGTASVVVDRTLHASATMTVVLFGIALSLAALDSLPNAVRIGFPVAIFGILLLIGFFFFHQRKGFSKPLIKLAQKLRIKRSFEPALLSKLEELDQNIREFYEYHHLRFFGAFGLHLLGRFLGILEVYAIGKILDPQFSFFIALTLTAVAPVINAMFTFIPGALGVMEGTYSGLLFILGLNPAIGIAIQVTKRVRAGFWIVVGLLILQTSSRNVDPSQPHPKYAR